MVCVISVLSLMVPFCAPATRMIRGASAQEVGRRRLDVYDPSYPVTIAIRAQRALEPA